MNRSRSGSLASTALLNAPTTHSAAALTTPVTSPLNASSALPTSPHATTPPPAPGEALPEAKQDTLDDVEVEDEFEALVRNMKESLQTLGGKGKVWLPERERRDFKIVLVDKVSLLCVSSSDNCTHRSLTKDAGHPVTSA